MCLANSWSTAKLYAVKGGAVLPVVVFNIFFQIHLGNFVWNNWSHFINGVHCVILEGV